MTIDWTHWLPWVLGMVAQAAITWWKVGQNERKIADHQRELESLREWRATIKERILRLAAAIKHHHGTEP